MKYSKGEMNCFSWKNAAWPTRIIQSYLQSFVQEVPWKSSVLQHFQDAFNFFATNLTSQVRKSRSLSKLLRVALPQQMKQSDVLCHRATERQVSQCTNLTHKANNENLTEQAKRVSTKQLSVVRQNVSEDKTERIIARTALFIVQSK